MTTSSSDPISAECLPIRELLEAHALRSLSPFEHDRVELHLLTCAACEQEFRSYADAISLLGLSAVQVDPSASVRDALLMAAQADLVRTGSDNMPTVNPTPRSPLWMRWHLPHALSAPTIGVFLLLGAVTLGSQYQLGTQRDKMDVLKRQNAGLVTHLDTIRLGQSTFGQNAIVYALNAPDAGDSAAGIVLGNPEQANALLSVWNLPASGGTYQVMAESDELGVVQVGNLIVAEGGVGSVQLSLPASLSSFRAMHVVRVDGAEEALGEVLHGDLTHPSHQPTSIT